jgi:hypothetical protein
LPQATDKLFHIRDKGQNNDVAYSHNPTTPDYSSSGDAVVVVIVREIQLAADREDQLSVGSERWWSIARNAI